MIGCGAERGGSGGCQSGTEGRSAHQFQHTFEVVSHHRQTYLDASSFANRKYLLRYPHYDGPDEEINSWEIEAMSLRKLAISMIVVSVASTTVLCQGGRSPTTGELLQQHNIPLTEAALVAALQGSDTEVRRLAALMLAENRAKDTIPSITQALAREKVPVNQVDIAFALAQLGEPKGFATLRSV